MEYLRAEIELDWILLLVKVSGSQNGQLLYVRHFSLAKVKVAKSVIARLRIAINPVDPFWLKLKVVKQANAHLRLARHLLSAYRTVYQYALAVPSSVLPVGHQHC